MIPVYRIVKSKHVSSAFDGQGAKIAGGRWNNKGVSVVYASGSLSLAAHETFVHLGYSGIKAKFSYFKVEIPDDVTVRRINAASLPSDWQMEPPPDSTKRLGSDWALKLETAVLVVPSTLIPGELNYLLNPAHPDFERLVIDSPMAFAFDVRYLKK